MPTLQLVATATEIYPTKEIPPVPVRPPQPTGGPHDLGTVHVFADRVQQKIGQENVVVGEHSGTCLHVRSPNMWLCHAGWTFENVEVTEGNKKTKMTGNLASGGLVDYDAFPEFVVAILGGTGGFAQVRGQVKGKFVAPTTEYTLEFTI
jgi:multimeric flavodoxin WrbA